MDAVVAAVTKPFAFTVSTGIAVEEPKDPTFEFTVARVKAADTFAVPSTPERVAVPSPVRDRSRAVAHEVAVSALPVTSPVILPLKVAVIVPALKSPEASLSTRVEAVFASVAALRVSTYSLPPITRLPVVPSG